ncbi:lysophospholipid acyltransferase family protein [Rhodovibrio salinarum]|uniref:1-acyl-sn-glycerol-3-phosphate acyltransferase n=1 Tax=Rhodovibrio salinarum TaxID=1087 RepID=A0A934QIC0_9PROT|nr:lysophospholipid acyltransferase family protein [Rhodovibrio salinarum]MBK1697100.1 1-acyl-sn-glycerol-3-phosphate acyltransferase [Rhodovibrio salinarum]
MILLRSLAFNVAFWVWTVSIHVPGLVLLIPGVPRRWIIVAGRFWIRGVMLLLRWVAGIDYQIRGRENLPDGPCLIASKHQSAWDTLIFNLILDDPSFVLKRELLFLPFFGWYLQRYGIVAIDRAGGAKTLRKMVAESKQITATGRRLIIFPEGTRVAPGDSKPYHPGVAALYRELKLPVVPVALTSGRHWGRRAFRKVPGTIRLEFQPPIPPGMDRKAFMQRLGDDLEAASERLRAEDDRTPRVH